MYRLVQLILAILYVFRKNSQGQVKANGCVDLFHRLKRFRKRRICFMANSNIMIQNKILFSKIDEFGDYNKMAQLFIQIHDHTCIVLMFSFVDIAYFMHLLYISLQYRIQIYIGLMALVELDNAKLTHPQGICFLDVALYFKTL